MKAVIMAGGEGTRLRPLTSNAPKPMLPVANRPMMEHVINLLRRHGIDEIVVTVAFMANAIRDYFGDGSRVRRASSPTSTSPRPLGTAGSVRNAAELLDERFLVISGDVITDIDLTQHHRLPRRRARRWPRSGSPRSTGPARVRHRDHPRGRLDRALPREADVGPGLQRHHQHRHLRARAGDLRLHRPGPAGRLLGRGLPARCWPTASRCSAPSPRATGRTSARWTPTSGPTRTCSTRWCSSTSPASRSPTACGWGRGPRSRPTPRPSARR